MSGYAGVTDRLDRTLSVLRRTLEALFYAVLIFALVCLIVLVAAGTYGIIHPGNDFGSLGGGVENTGGDVIVPRVLR